MQPGSKSNSHFDPNKIDGVKITTLICSVYILNQPFTFY